MLQPVRNNFLNIPDKLSDPETSAALVLPLPLDITASWKRGTADGPAAIIAASHHIEYYDEELGLDPITELGGIATYPELELPADPADAARKVQHLAAGLVRKDRLLVSLGGEHSLTYPLVSAHRERWPDLCVLQIDAHADLREEYMGSPHNHACPMKRLMDMGVHVTAVGVRSVDEAEAPLLNNSIRRTFLDCRIHGRVLQVLPEIIDSLPSDHVYLTIDLDGLDPALVPAVGTPVPGGLSWHEVTGLVRELANSRKIIGADVVELMPREGLHVSDAVAARLVYKIISYAMLARRK